jgi:bifunctional DNA-binding transcriptional regulator/antitoxin component of YhaV-PrlF toxin-antitoxin module
VRRGTESVVEYTVKVCVIRKAREKGSFHVFIPAPIIKRLGWSEGDLLRIDADYNADAVKLQRIYRARRVPISHI